jgi:hypothetical protein
MNTRTPKPKRRFLGLSCGQIALLGVLGIITLGIVLVGGFFILGDTGLIQTPISFFTRSSATQQPATTEFVATIAPTPVPLQTEGVSLPPSWTPTIAPTPLPFTFTPRPTSSVTPDWSEWTLKLDDLPEGFEEIALEDIAATAYEVLFGDDAELSSVFGFIYSSRTDEDDTITGFTVYLPTGEERFTFSKGLDQPEQLLDSIIESLEVEEVFDQAMLLGLEEIGDASIGLTITARIDNVDWRIDIVPFRTEDTGAVVMVKYQDSISPIMTVEEAAAALNRRIVEASIETD